MSDRTRPPPTQWGLCSYFKRQNSLIEVKRMERNKLKTNKNTVSPQTEGRPTREAPRLCRVACKLHGYQEMSVPDVCWTCVITGEAFPLSGCHCIPGRRRLCCISLCELQEQIDPSTLTAPNTKESAQGSQFFLSSGSLSETFFFSLIFFAMSLNVFPRPFLNFWAQAILLPQLPKCLGWQVHSTMPG